MQVTWLGLQIEYAGYDFARCMPLLQVLHGRYPIMRVVVGGHLAQSEPCSVVLHDFLDRPRRIVRIDLVALWDDIEAVDGIIMLAHIIEALARAPVSIKGEARRDAVDECGPVMLDCRLDHRQ